MDTIRVEELSKRYGRIEALRGVDLRVPEGAVFGLVGPNGAGKTTLIKVLVGALRPSGGEVGVLGLDPLIREGGAQAADRLHATVLGPLRGPLGARQHQVLWRRPRNPRAQEEDCRSPGVHRHDGAGEGPRLQTLGRDEAACLTGLRPRPPATDTLPERAHGRREPERSEEHTSEL